MSGHWENYAAQLPPTLSTEEGMPKAPPPPTREERQTRALEKIAEALINITAELHKMVVRINP